MQSTDQLGTVFEFQSPPKRIVSLVPSITEWLFDLGMGEEVVGITKFCVRPQAWFRSKTRVGGTKQIHLSKIRELAPDLVIANKEENESSDVEAIREFCPVWVSDVRNWNDAFELMQLLGAVLDRKEAALKIRQNIALPNAISPRKTAAYAIWNEPLMFAGTDTFIHDTMAKLGFDNVVTQPRYPAFSDEDLRALNPQILLLPSEPFPFAQKHLPDLQARFPDTELLLVDGEMFSWYGSRMMFVRKYGEELAEELRARARG